MGRKILLEINCGQTTCENCDMGSLTGDKCRQFFLPGGMFMPVRGEGVHEQRVRCQQCLDAEAAADAQEEIARRVLDDFHTQNRVAIKMQEERDVALARAADLGDEIKRLYADADGAGR